MECHNSSDFITEGSPGGIEILDLCGATSLAYKICIDGQVCFMKKLRPELRSDSRYRDLFYKEFNTGKSIRSPYIVKYLNIKDDADGLCIIMEYVNGQTLKEKIEKKPEYFRQEKNIKNLLLQLCEALKALHNENVAHLDITPSNIIISQISNNVKLIDLGFCVSDWNDQTAGTSTMFGAPEAMTSGIKDIDIRSDIYSIGRLLQYIEEKTGARFPRYINRIKRRCLQQDKNRRYATTDEIVYAIRDHRNNILVKIAASISIVATLAIGFIASGVHTALYNYIGWERGVFPSRFEVDGIFYNITDDEARTVEVTFKGNSPKEFEYEYKGGEIIIPQTVTYKGRTFRVTAFASMAFNNPYITRITIPDGIEVIADSAFTYCSQDGVITIPASVKKIGVSAFFPVFDIDGLVVDAKNEYYDSRNGCNAIIETSTNTLIAGCSKTVIPEGIISIARNAFLAAEELKQVVLPQSLKVIGEAAFVHSGITEIDIPEGVTTLERYTFQYCVDLQKVTFPQSLETINTAALSHCGFKEVVIPDNVTVIGDYAFDYCELLEKVVIGKRVESIGHYAFDGCKRLKTVISNIQADVLPNISNTVFSNIAEGNVLYVPKGTKSVYENTSGWNNFDRIVEM